MTSFRKACLTIWCFGVFLSQEAVAQQDTVLEGMHTSLGIRAGYGLPVGDWTMNRIAPEVKLFSGDVAVEGDITFRLGRKWGLVLGVGYMGLNGTKWEQYAESEGDYVTVSGSLVDAFIGFRPLLYSSPANQIAFEFGAVGLFASGEEVVNGERYSYDFFSSFRVGVQGALEYDRIMSEGFALTLRAGCVVMPDGMNYADGVSRTIMYIPLTAGIRFLF